MYFYRPSYRSSASPGGTGECDCAERGSGFLVIGVDGFESLVEEIGALFKEHR
jgi:hypothetical protein